MRNVFAGPTLNFGIYPQFHADFHLFGPLVYPPHLIYRFLSLFASCLCLRFFPPSIYRANFLAKFCSTLIIIHEFCWIFTRCSFAGEIYSVSAAHSGRIACAYDTALTSSLSAHSKVSKSKGVSFSKRIICPCRSKSACSSANPREAWSGYERTRSALAKSKSLVLRMLIFEFF